MNVLTFEIPMHCNVGFAQNPFWLVQCMDGHITFLFLFYLRKTLLITVLLKRRSLIKVEESLLLSTKLLAGNFFSHFKQ